MKDLKVLVVEDDAATAADIRHRLESFGCQLLKGAVTGEDAVSIVERERPDIVIMDITLHGDIDGIEAAAVIRSNYAVPVIFMTGDSNDDTVMNATAVDPYGYILKPVESRSLSIALRMAMARYDLEVKVRQTETALRFSEERYRALVESSRDGIIVVLDSDIIFFNGAAEEILGIGGINEECGGKIDHLMPPSVCEKIRGAVSGAFEELPALMEWPYRHPDGSRRYLEATASVIFKDAQKALLMHLRDVTERRLADKALIESQRRLDMVLKGGNLGYWDWDRETGHVTYNRRWSKMLGYHYEDLEPEIEDWIERIHPEDREFVVNALEAHLGGESPCFEEEYRIRAKSGQYKWLLSNGLVMEWRDGEPRRVTTVSIDITDRKGAEEEVTRLNRDLERRVAARTAELERANRELKDFAYVVSHDLKAPLRGINQLVNWLRNDYRDVINQEGRDHMGLIVDRVRRMNQLIEGVLEYSRLGRVSGHRELTDCNEIIEEIREMIMPPENITIRIENRLPFIEMERVRLEQIFQNLVVNAVQQMNEAGGEVTILSKDDGAFWQFCVSDNGPGIDVRYHEKIFKIFQTLGNREERGGTGIGLTLVKKIIENLGGEIWLESEVGHGSSFFFTIPKGEAVYQEQETGSCR